jgi:nucleotide-binding universal stress UspA family protein
LSALAELDALLAARAGPLELWWRDDDAGRDHPALARLLELSARHAAPLSLAVVPDWLEPAATARIAAAPAATVMQHGVAHKDHALPCERRIELGGSADPEKLGPAIEAGRERLAATFSRAFLPVMVPPWNRIAAAFAGRLPAWGFEGFSGLRGGGPTLPDGLARLDVHLDAVHWRERRCLTFEELLERLAAELRAGVEGPVGLLSHHLVIDAGGIEALDRLLDLVQIHAKLRVAPAAMLLREAR